MYAAWCCVVLCHYVWSDLCGAGLCSVSLLAVEWCDVVVLCCVMCCHGLWLRCSVVMWCALRCPVQSGVVSY